MPEPERTESTSPDPDRIFVEMHPDAARRFANVLLNVATTAERSDREWLLWAVGLTAQAMHQYPEGPDG